MRHTPIALLVTLPLYGTGAAQPVLESEPLLLPGDPLPGTGAGVFKSASGAYISDDGRWVLVCDLERSDASGVTSLNDSGVWLGREGTLSLVAREGDSAPGIEGAVFAQFTGPFLLNPPTGMEGAFLLKHDIAETSAGYAEDTGAGLWGFSDDGLRLVIQRGGEIPGRPGARFGYIDGAQVFDDAIIVRTCTNLDSPEGESQPSLWRFDESGATRVIGRDDEAPGLPGQRFQFFEALFEPAVSALPIWAYLGISEPDEQGGRLLTDPGLWIYDGEQVQLVGLAGQQAPGVEGTYTHFGSAVSNTQGEVLYVAGFNETGVSRAGRFGVGLWKRSGRQTELILRSGDGLPGVTGTLLSISELRSNAKGDIAFFAQIRPEAPVDANDIDAAVFMMIDGELRLVLEGDQPVTGAPGERFHPDYPATCLELNERGDLVFYTSSYIESANPMGASKHGIWRYRSDLDTLDCVVHDRSKVNVSRDPASPDIREVLIWELRLGELLSDTGDIVFSARYEGGDAGSVPFICPLQANPLTACRADLDHDLDVDLGDFGLFAANFGATSDGQPLPGDLNFDSVVDLQDFAIFGAEFDRDTAECAP